jgi:hypothetical protein
MNYSIDIDTIYMISALAAKNEETDSFAENVFQYLVVEKILSKISADEQPSS